MVIASWNFSSRQLPNNFNAFQNSEKNDTVILTKKRAAQRATIAHLKASK